MQTIFELHPAPWKVAFHGAMHHIKDANDNQVAQLKTCESAHALCAEMNTVWQAEYASGE